MRVKGFGLVMWVGGLGARFGAHGLPARLVQCDQRRGRIDMRPVQIKGRVISVVVMIVFMIIPVSCHHMK